MDLEAKKLFEKEHFAHELRMKLLEAHDGYAKLEAEVKPQLANLYGFVHGRLIFLWLTLLLLYPLIWKDLLPLCNSV